VASELSTAVRALAIGGRVLERALDDMTLPQFRVLRAIDASPERASRIAEKAAVSRPSLTGLLDGLEARGWVERSEVAGDRRGVGLAVTADGRTALRAADRAMTARLNEVLAAGDPADAALVLDGLAAFARTIDVVHAALSAGAGRP
jgi:DNA-binding MarR family transcriptional regulator